MGHVPVVKEFTFQWKEINSKQISEKNIAYQTVINATKKYKGAGCEGSGYTLQNLVREGLSKMTFD